MQQSTSIRREIFSGSDKVLWPTSNESVCVIWSLKMKLKTHIGRTFFVLQLIGSLSQSMKFLFQIKLFVNKNAPLEGNALSYQQCRSSQ